MDFINKVFRNYLDSFVIVFIHDILVYSKSEDDHMGHLRIELQVLKEHQVFAKYSKCKFWFRSIACVFNIISSEGIKFDLKQMEVIKNWPRPFNQNNITSFFGLAGYYRRFLMG